MNHKYKIGDSAFVKIGAAKNMYKNDYLHDYIKQYEQTTMTVIGLRKRELTDCLISNVPIYEFFNGVYSVFIPESLLIFNLEREQMLEIESVL